MSGGVPGAWRRVVVKVGTSSLTDASGRIHPPSMWAIARGARTLAAALAAPAPGGAGGASEHAGGVVLVSSGAGAAGRERLGLRLPLTLPDKQAAAAVGQALLMLDWARALAPLPVAQLLLTADDVRERARYVNAKATLEACLARGAVPIVNENDSVATSEIRLGDNDTLSAWTAYLADADALVILTDVDGLYTADPRRDPSARRLDVVRDLAGVEGVAGAAGTSRGTGGMATKLGAVRIAAEAGIETLVIGGGGEGLEALARGEVRGTRFPAPGRRSARKAWIAQQPARGALVVDEGAARALRSGRSLLPAGVREARGDFGFGDAVDVLGEDGAPLGRGLVNYGSDALARILGRRSSEIPALLGREAHYDEAVHRDNLALRGEGAPRSGGAGDG